MKGVVLSASFSGLWKVLLSVGPRLTPTETVNYQRWQSSFHLATITHIPQPPSKDLQSSPPGSWRVVWGVWGPAEGRRRRRLMTFVLQALCINVTPQWRHTMTTTCVQRKGVNNKERVKNQQHKQCRKCTIVEANSTCTLGCYSVTCILCNCFYFHIVQLGFIVCHEKKCFSQMVGTWEKVLRLLLSQFCTINVLKIPL